VHARDLVAVGFTATGRQNDARTWPRSRVIARRGWGLSAWRPRFPRRVLGMILAQAGMMMHVGPSSGRWRNAYLGSRAAAAASPYQRDRQPGRIWALKSWGKWPERHGDFAARAWPVMGEGSRGFLCGIQRRCRRERADGTPCSRTHLRIGSRGAAFPRLARLLELQSLFPTAIAAAGRLDLSKRSPQALGCIYTSSALGECSFWEPFMLTFYAPSLHPAGCIIYIPSGVQKTRS